MHPELALWKLWHQAADILIPCIFQRYSKESPVKHQQRISSKGLNNLGARAVADSQFQASYKNTFFNILSCFRNLTAVCRIMQSWLTESQLRDFKWSQFRGCGYGLGVRTHMDPAVSGLICNRGEFYQPRLRNVVYSCL